MRIVENFPPPPPKPPRTFTLDVTEEELRELMHALCYRSNEMATELYHTAHTALN